MVMPTPGTARSSRLAVALVALFALDRLLKLAAVVAFFRRVTPPAPPTWPSVTLVQPLTRGEHDLAPILRARLALDYPGPVQHVLVCDRADAATQATCRAILGEGAEVALADPEPGGRIALKIAKLRVGLERACGEIVCCVDDDIGLRPASLQALVAPLHQPGIGSTFGLACYTEWESVWSSLMSLFVNTNALMSYVPLTYLTEPFTITGHCFALRRTTLAAVGGFEGLDGRLDDDHELARRVRAHGLRLAQTPLNYDVTNRLDSFAAYRAQLRRWFIFPRQAMLPALTRRERLILSVGSLGNLVPGLLALLTLLARRRAPALALAFALALVTGIHALTERAYLKRGTPTLRRSLLPLVAIGTPWQILAALFAPPIVEWRGQRLHVERGGRFTVLGPAGD